MDRTADKIRRELENIGFAVEQIEPMGGMFAVIYDILYVALGIASRNRNKITNRLVNRFVMPVIRWMFLYLDKRFIYKARWITTGWFSISISRKRDVNW